MLDLVCKRGVLVGLCVCSALLLPVRAARAQWPTFHGDNWRTGRARVDFPSADLQLLWTFSLGEHTWRYEKGMSVWSASPVVADVNGVTTIYVGAYDHNLYALDAAEGRVLWRYTTGGALNAAPACAEVGDRALIFIGSADRRFYAIDALTGQKAWSYETMPWTYTAGPATPSAPLVAEVAGRHVVYVSFCNTDHRPGQSVQRGEIFAFEAGSGRLLWRHFLTTNPMSAPVLVDCGHRHLLILGSRDGAIYAVDAISGDDVWQVICGHSVMASPAVTMVKGRSALICGDFFGMLYCLDARNGAWIWKRKLGHMVNGTAAIAGMSGQPIACVPCYDRRLYAVAASTGQPVWCLLTRKYIAASPVVATIGQMPAVFCSSLDNRLFAVDVRSGVKLWEFEYGDMLWPYETRGECIWSSPVVAQVKGRPMLFFGAHDGKLYAFTSASGGSETAPAKGGTGHLSQRTTGHSSWLGSVVPGVGFTLLLAGLAVMLFGQRKAT